MITVNSNTLGIVCSDSKCKDEEELFPPYRLEPFKDGTTIFGAAKRSFFVSKGRSSYVIDGEEKDYEGFLDQLRIVLSAIQNPEGQLVKQEDPPSDTGLLWQKGNEIYFFDGSQWLEVVEKSILATEPGSTANNTFLKIGDVRTTPIRGWTIPDDIKITRATWSNASGANTSFLLFESGVLVANINTTSASRGQSETSPSPLQLSKNGFLTIQYTGPNNNNIYLQLFYRKIAV